MQPKSNAESTLNTNEILPILGNSANNPNNEPLYNEDLITACKALGLKKPVKEIYQLLQNSKDPEYNLVKIHTVYHVFSGLSNNAHVLNLLTSLGIIHHRIPVIPYARKKPFNNRKNKIIKIGS
ncbi:hypothetical protein AB3N59_20205 (plasmid) [Leptospira sp. WS92.C1]